MKKFKIHIPALACMIILAGCAKTAEEAGQPPASGVLETGASAQPSASGALESVPSGQPPVDAALESKASAPPSAEGDSEWTQQEPAQAAYATFLSGDISLFDSADIDTWSLDTWKDTILFYGELEYAYLDLDGDGMEELLVQWVDDPCGFNGVFHYDNGRLYCWQYDCVEASCRDYPLRDGTMVHQYDYNGARSYSLFRYQADGEAEWLLSLFAREELIYADSTVPCPYYEVDGNEVDKTEFDEQLRNLITDQMLERSAWTAL